MTTTDDHQRRRPGRPEGTLNRSDRWHAHTDAERDRARARVRSARAALEWAEEELEAAGIEAYRVGINAPELARLMGIKPGRATAEIVRKARSADAGS